MWCANVAKGSYWQIDLSAYDRLNSQMTDRHIFIRLHQLSGQNTTKILWWQNSYFKRKIFETVPAIKEIQASSDCGCKIVLICAYFIWVFDWINLKAKDLHKHKILEWQGAFFKVNIIQGSLFSETYEFLTEITL